METIIHFGQHKTGTTSLQQFLFDNREGLAKQGIYVPTAFMGKASANHYDLNLVTLASNRSSPMKDRFNGDLHAHKKLVINEIDVAYKMASKHKCKKILWSNEGLSFLRFQQEYKDLYDLFSAHSTKIAAVICLRSREEWKRSWAAQLQKMGFDEEKYDIDSYRYLGDDSWLFQWEERLSVMSHVFDALTVYDYKPKLSIGLFCDALNIDLRDIGRIKDDVYQLNVTPGFAELGQHKLSLKRKKPNIIFVFADQLRGDALGCEGDVNAMTPFLDDFAGENISVSAAVSGCSVCSPYRASLLSGQRPLTHKVVINDAVLDKDITSIASAFGDSGYKTIYIGKWHVFGCPDGSRDRRNSYVPRDSQLGFDVWKGFECSHNYLKSPYYSGSDSEINFWDGYDAKAQTREAIRLIKDSGEDEFPLFLMLSWGPPHDPYHLVPKEYLEKYKNREIVLRPNVPSAFFDKARSSLAGYYAHISALDECFGELIKALQGLGLYDESIVVFTSDHGDMHYSQGLTTKMYPFEESIRIPFLLKLPESWGVPPCKIPIPLNAEDIMPTLLGLIESDIPVSVEGRDWSEHILLKKDIDPRDFSLLTMPIVFHELWKNQLPCYRGLRSMHYTYVENEAGPWLLFDNDGDPYQMTNLAHSFAHRDLVEVLSSDLASALDSNDDDFASSDYYENQFGLQKHVALRTRAKQVKWRYPWFGSK